MHQGNVAQISKNHKIKQMPANIDLKKRERNVLYLQKQIRLIKGNIARLIFIQGTSWTRLRFFIYFRANKYITFILDIHNTFFNYMCLKWFFKSNLCQIHFHAHSKPFGTPICKDKKMFMSMICLKTFHKLLWTRSVKTFFIYHNCQNMVIS